MSHRRRSKSDLPAYVHALNLAHEGEGPEPDCKDHSDEFVDFPLSEAPDEELASLLCSRCPLIKECLANARHRKPAHGVWGGRLWIGGRQAHLMDGDDPRLTESVD